MNKVTENAKKIIDKMNIKIHKQKRYKNVILKEIRQRGFQNKKKTKHGIKTLENIRFGECVYEINGDISTKEEYENKYANITKTGYIKSISNETTNSKENLYSQIITNNIECKVYETKIHSNEDYSTKNENTAKKNISNNILKQKLKDFILYSLQHKNNNTKNCKVKECDHTNKKPNFSYFITDNLVLTSENNIFRKGCRPNVAIKIKRDSNKYHIGFYSTRYINAKEEIVLPFDTTNNNQEKCICSDLEYCLSTNTYNKY